MLAASRMALELTSECLHFMVVDGGSMARRVSEGVQRGCRHGEHECIMHLLGGRQSEQARVYNVVGGVASTGTLRGG